jgi:hypothetical protein
MAFNRPCGLSRPLIDAPSVCTTGVVTEDETTHIAQRRSTLKFKPMLAVAAASLGAMAFASPALALPGDDAIDSSSPFRLNTHTLEPGCTTRADLDSHIDLTALVDGDLVEELHVTVSNGSPVSVDQVLVAGHNGGYRIYNTFDTGTSGTDADVDPNQTAVDLFGPDGTSFIDNDDVIVCVSDHNDDVQNEPYVQEAGGLVAAKNRPVIVPIVSCLGVSAIEPLNTYKAGFGYTVERGYVQDRFTSLLGIRDPNARDTDGDGVIDAVRIGVREDPGVFDARRVNDVDSAGEAFSGDKDDYGQTRLFSLAGDPTAWTLSNNNDPDTLSNLITFTTQGDLPLTWTLRASLAQSNTLRSVSLTDDMVRAWEASWQAYYDGGAKPSMALCPGTNSPAPDNIDVINLPQTSPPPAPGATNTVTRETTVIRTVAGATQVVQVAGKKARSAKKSKFRSCMKKAKAKKGKKARKRAKARCRRKFA